MKYIIMCGGKYENWETPRQLMKIRGEEIVARTVRLLKENGIEDIAISSDNPAFDNFGVPRLEHDNDFSLKDENTYWMAAFYPTDEPTTYLFGDVVYSPEAIRKIIETETNDIEFFGSCPPYGEGYFKPYQEPFAFKVVDTDHLKQAIIDCKKNDKAGMFWRRPIAWELWTTIKDGVLSEIPDVYKPNYTAINDYTCDVDSIDDAAKIEAAMPR